MTASTLASGVERSTSSTSPWRSAARPPRADDRRRSVRARAVGRRRGTSYRLREPRSAKRPRGVARCAHDRDGDQVVGAGSRLASERQERGVVRRGPWFQGLHAPVLGQQPASRCAGGGVTGATGEGGRKNRARRAYRLREARSVKRSRVVARCAYDRDGDQVVGADSRLASERQERGGVRRGPWFQGLHAPVLGQQPASSGAGDGVAGVTDEGGRENRARRASAGTVASDA
jgi:hypothetical protein